jgi:hypothetical protein
MILLQGPLKERPELEGRAEINLRELLPCIGVGVPNLLLASTVHFVEKVGPERRHVGLGGSPVLFLLFLNGGTAGNTRIETRGHTDGQNLVLEAPGDAFLYRTHANPQNTKRKSPGERIPGAFLGWAFSDG